MTKSPKEQGFTKILELWMASDLQTQLLVFYRDNPGTLETLEGLATRLGADVKALRREIADQVAVGLMQERKAGATTFLVLDRKREGEVAKAIEKRVREHTAAKEGQG